MCWVKADFHEVGRQSTTFFLGILLFCSTITCQLQKKLYLLAFTSSQVYQQLMLSVDLYECFQADMLSLHAQFITLELQSWLCTQPALLLLSLANNCKINQFTTHQLLLIVLAYGPNRLKWMQLTPRLVELTIGYLSLRGEGEEQDV